MRRVERVEGTPSHRRRESFDSLCSKWKLSHSEKGPSMKRIPRSKTF